MPKVSVIIPTYNRAKLVCETIQSVLEQTFRDFEIIVIDDGSTDNTAEVLSSLPVRYFWQENRGLPFALNRGIELAEGEYVMTLGSDDALLPYALAKSVEALDSHPEAAFSYGQAYLVDNEGKVMGFSAPRSKPSSVRQGWEDVKDYLVLGNHFAASTFMARRSCLKEVGGFDVTSRSEDLELCVRLSKKHAVAYIAEPLIRYRIHQDRISSQRSLSEWEKTNSLIIDSIIKDPDLSKFITPEAGAKAYSRLYSDMANRYRDRGDIRTAWRYIFMALRVHPAGLLSKSGLHWMRKFSIVLLPAPVLTPVRAAKRYLLSSFGRL